MTAEPIYPIAPDHFCVPSALMALTGANPASVIYPSINRHSKNPSLLDGDGITAVRVSVARAVLAELGYRIRPARDKARHTVATWAARSIERWPDKRLMVTTNDHMLVIQRGVVYDNHAPAGMFGERHPFANSIVTSCNLVERK